MYAKGTMGFLGALALVLSMIPVAAAGIPIPGETTVNVIYDGAQTATEAGDSAVDGAAGAYMILDVGVNQFSRSVGDMFAPAPGGIIGLNNADINVLALVNAASGASTVLFAAGEQEQGRLFAYGVDSAFILGEAGEGTTDGTIQTAAAGIDTTVDFGFATQRAVDTAVLSLGASTQSVAGSAGGVTNVAVQGGVNTYNNHAAPAMCAFAGIAADFTGAVDSGSSCGALLL